jgi:hypothetical protein
MSLRLQKDIACDALSADTVATNLSSTTRVDTAETVSASNFIPSQSLSTTSITLTTGSTFASGSNDRWTAGVLAQNGKIYCIPRRATEVGVIDAVANTFDTTSVLPINGTSMSNTKWFSGCLAPNGKIYGAPHNFSRGVVVIDPVENTIDDSVVTLTTGSSFGSGAQLYGSTCPGIDGKLYCMPTSATNVCVIDPELNTADTTLFTLSTGSSLAATYKTYGSVLGPDGKIYGIPYAGQEVCVIDPATKIVSTNSITAAAGSTFSGFGKWFGGALAPNGKIYGAPYSIASVCVIDPIAKTIDTTSVVPAPGVATLTTTQYKYAGAVLAMDGKIYCMPQNATDVLQIDPTTNQYSRISASVGSTLAGNFKYEATTLGPSGKIYGIPSNALNVAVLKPGIPTLPPWMLAPEFNKF